MIKIDKKYYPKVFDLYEKCGQEFLLISCVILNTQEGSIWADDYINPTNAFVVNKFGFCYEFGMPHDRDFEEFVTNLAFKDSELKNKYLLWYMPSESRIKMLDNCPTEMVRRRERIQFEFNKDIYKQISYPLRSLPDGFKTENLNTGNIDKTSVFNLNIRERFWLSYEDFLKNGYGFCVFDENGNAVSICYTACVSKAKTEIDVATLEGYRGKNFASYVVKSFIDYSLSISITPHWDCFDYNTPSINIAEKLGFNRKNKYPFYSINRDKLR